jgi:hypothetical protein
MFVEDERVDVIVLGNVRPCVRNVFWDDDDLRADGESGEARHDESLAALAGGDAAMPVDLRGGVVV